MKHFQTTIKVAADIAQQQEKPSLVEINKVVDATEKLKQKPATGKSQA